MAGKIHARWQRLSVPPADHPLESGSSQIFDIPEILRLKSGFGSSADLKNAQSAARIAALALPGNNPGV
jgi:hypothetical protein